MTTSIFKRVSHSTSNSLPVLFAFLLLAGTAVASFQVQFNFAAPLLTSSILVLSVVIGIGNLLQIIKDVLISNRVHFWIRIVVFVNILFYFFVAIELIFVRMIGQFEGILWQIDWRHALGHAYSLSRYPDNSNNLAYDGFEVNYHAAASLLAGHLMSVTGIDAFYTLFLVIPILTLTSLLLFMRSLSKSLNIKPIITYILGLIALTIPVFQIKYFSIGEVKATFTYLALDNQVMINSYLALAVCFSTLILHFSTNNLKMRLLASVVPMFSLMGLKPQFIPFLGIILYLLNSKSYLNRIPFTFRFRFIFFLCTFSALILAFLEKASGDLRLELSLNAYKIYALQGFALPFLTFCSIISILILFFLRNKILIPQTINWIIVSFFCYFALRTISGFILFQNPAFNTLPTSIKGVYTSSGVDLDLEQGFVLLNLALLFSLLIRGALSCQHKKYFLTFMVILLILSNIFKASNYVDQFKRPLTRGFEAIDNREVSQLLNNLDPSSLVLLNDLADPAMNFTYVGRGNYLLVNDRVRFYFANVLPEWQATDFTDRYTKVKRFFGTPISSFHRDFLLDSGITHILISKRCIPAWRIDHERVQATSDFYLIEADKMFQLFDFEHVTRHAGQIIQPQLKMFGIGNCL
jgi:hypothetical protein